MNATVRGQTRHGRWTHRPRVDRRRHRCLARPYFKLTHYPRNPQVDRALRPGYRSRLSPTGPRFERVGMKTFSLRKEDVTHRWFVVDAAGQPLGRLASRVAQILRGKHKPTYTPHLNGGDCVVVVNAAKVKLTGRKLEQKRYFRHTGYMGHERFQAVKDVLATHPERVIERAVWGMLPKTTLSRQKVKQMLKVYGGADHPHAAQRPEPLPAAAAR
jgi:large subunit ribosomal protein L13